MLALCKNKFPIHLAIPWWMWEGLSFSLRDMIVLTWKRRFCFYHQRGSLSPRALYHLVSEKNIDLPYRNKCHISRYLTPRAFCRNFPSGFGICLQEIKACFVRGLFTYSQRSWFTQISTSSQELKISSQHKVCTVTWNVNFMLDWMWTAPGNIRLRGRRWWKQREMGNMM